ncbi:MAG: NYN domain-containing protein [Clostridiales bacterium]|nr:NYN domain-containing protein [Clostridiales bacterium]
MPLTTFLIVDGYNIIHAWPELEDLTSVSLESARVKLMDILCNYQGVSGETVILVFDGYLVKGSTGTVMQYNNIYVVYTKEAETADHYIERTVTKIPKEYRVKVATNDGLEQAIIMGKGATRITARELKMIINEEEKNIRNNYTENRPAKNNMLMDNVDDETLAWLEMMRRKKG